MGSARQYPRERRALIPALNKQGVVADVIGTGALTHTQQATANFKVAYDLSSTVRATYSLGIWNNLQDSSPESYLRTTSGAPTFGGAAGSSFAGNRYAWNQTQMSNAVSLKSDSRGLYDFDLSASSYNYLQDELLNSLHRHGYRRWLLGERQDHPQRRHELAERRRQVEFGDLSVSMGLRKSALAFTVTDTISTTRPTARRPGITPSSGNGQIFSDGLGETQTGALWLQDAWKIVSNVKLTLGGRLEDWRAFDGFNLNSTTDGEQLARRESQLDRRSRPASRNCTRRISRRKRHCLTT